MKPANRSKLALGALLAIVWLACQDVDRSVARGRPMTTHGPASTAAALDRGTIVRLEVAPAHARGRSPVEAPEPAPTIGGRVVDPHGLPCPSTYLLAVADHFGPCASAITDAEGRFTIPLAQKSLHRMGVVGRTLRATRQDNSPSFLPGERDAVLVVQDIPTLLFRVVDAQSAQELPSFRLSLADSPTRSRETPHFMPVGFGDSFESGAPRIEARAQDQFVAASADGFATLETRVVEDAGSPGMQTLRLTRGGSVVGKLGSIPPASARVELTIERDLRKLDPSRPDEDDREQSDNYAYDLGNVAGAVRRFDALRDGEFRIGGLSAGTYRLKLRVDGLAERVLGGLAVQDAGRLDLGVIELAAQSAIDGTLIGRDAQFQDAWITLSRVRATRTEDCASMGADESGRFRFASLEAGNYTLLLEGRLDRFQMSRSLNLTLGPGETRSVDFDLSALGCCEAKVQVLRAGTAAPGLRISFAARIDSEWSASGSTETNAAGIASGLFPAGIQGRFEVLAPSSLAGGLLLGCSDECALPRGGRKHEVIELAPGRLTLQLPEGVLDCERDGMRVFVREAGPSPSYLPHVFFVGSDWGEPLVAHSPPTDRSLDLGEIAPGGFELRLWIKDVDSARIPAVDAATAPGIHSLPRREFQIRAGQTTRVSWP